MDLSELLKVDREGPGARLRKALRLHVRDQVALFLTRNAPLDANIDKLEVHHEPPNTFAALAKHFAEVAERSGLSLKVKYPGRLADPETIAAWKQYHAENAKLTIIDRDEHRRRHLKAV